MDFNSNYEESNICRPKCKNVYNLQENGISKKTLISQIIKKKYSINYSNSQTASIYKTILSLDYDSNKKLLLLLKYILYMKYFKQLMSCGNYNSEILNLMIETIITNLTTDEYNIAFDIKKTIDSSSNIVINESQNKITKTFYVTVDINKQFFLIKNYNGEYIELNKSYEFNLEDPSNLNTQFCLSINESGTPIKVDCLVYNGIPGTPGSKLIMNTPSNLLYVFSIYIFNSLFKIPYSWGYGIPKLFIKNPNNNIHRYSSYIPLTLNQTCYLSVYYNESLKFLIQNSFILPNQSVNYNYVLYYGTYYLKVPKIYSLALLNKGQENKIQYTGIINTSKRSTIYGTMGDGTYNFFYDTLTISVYESFTPISLYSQLYGYLGTGSAITFDSIAAKNAEPDIRIDHPIDSNGIESLYGQTRVNVDFLNNKITLNNDKNYNASMATLYGMYNGTYIFYTTKYITFLNKNKENIFIVSGLNGIKGSGPDGITNYTFYSGVIQVKVVGDFNKMSIYTLNKGYCGGLYLLNYDEYYNNFLPHSYSFTNIQNHLLNDPIPTIYNTFIPLNSTNLDFSNDNGTSFNKPINSYNVIQLDTTGNFVFTDVVGNKIPYNSKTQYTMTKGTYVFFNDTPFYIAFLTKNKPVNATGYNVGSYFTISNAPNGDLYTFNKSEKTVLALLNPIIVKVENDFGYLSISTTNKYSGGQNIISYISF